MDLDPEPDNTVRNALVAIYVPGVAIIAGVALYNGSPLWLAAIRAVTWPLALLFGQFAAMG